MKEIFQAQQKERKGKESEVVQSCPTLQPHGLLPIRLLRPWDFPGKGIGVGCHFLLQGGLPDPGIEPGSPTLQADALPSKPQGSPGTTEALVIYMEG